MKTPLRQNMGILDRMLRTFVGMALIVLGTVVVQGTVGTVLLILSIPPIITGMTGFCPTYTLLNISTKSASSCC